jgi:AcrR family transcriptional regulator
MSTMKQSTPRALDLARSTLSARFSENGILRAAVEVFARHGFSGTRVEDILAAAGIARRTFYKYFGCKEDVLASIYELMTRELVSAIQSAGAPLALSSTAEPLEAIWRALDVYLDYHVANKKLLGVLVEQAIRKDSPLAPLRQRFRDELVRLIDAAVRASTGAEHDPLLYVALLSAVEGVSLELLRTDAGPRDVERARKALRFIAGRTIQP